MMIPDKNINISNESTKNVYEVADKYAELFPPFLNKTDDSPVPVMGQWKQKLKVKPSIIKQVFYIFKKDRKYQNVINEQVGEHDKHCKICISIMQKTCTSIKIISCMDQSLKVWIIGKKEAVLEAQWLIVKELAKQASVAIPIPKQHHVYISGKYGEKLDYLQLFSVTKIIVPHPSDNLDLIVITGTKDGIDKAAEEIELISDKLASYINIPIPKKHHKSIIEKIGQKLAYWKLIAVSKITVIHPKNNSDTIMIKITGTEEELENARQEIQLILDEQSFEQLNIPRVYLPFIFGPFNDVLDQIMYETGARIHIPHPSGNKIELTIDGEKEGVAAAKDKIIKIYEERRRNCVVISPKVLKKHIIGLQHRVVEEILAETGVSVEIPPSDSNCETITLRGEQAKLQSALDLIYSKAFSE